MVAKVDFKHGGVSYQFEFEEKNTMDTLHQAIVLSNPRRKCDACGNKDQDKFRFDTNKDTDGNIYVNNICRACGAKSKLGQYKAGGYFWKNFEKWEKSSSEEDTSKEKAAPAKGNEDAGQEGSSDDLPF